MAGTIADAGNLGWNTPQIIVDYVKEFFNGNIGLDPCSNPGSIVNAKENWIYPEHNGLSESWDKNSVYCNPPYGSSYLYEGRCLLPKEYRELSKRQKAQCKRQTLYDWVKKAETENKAETILLIPACVDTKAWQEIIFPLATAICFIKGRVMFIGSKTGCSTPLSLVYFGEPDRLTAFQNIMDKFGYVVPDDY